MTYDLRTVTFAADLIIKPANHLPKALQRVHEAAFSHDTCAYKNFAVIPGGAQLSNPVARAGAISAATVLPDRIRVQEQSTGIIREDFESRLAQFAAITMQHLGLSTFLAQQFVVQSLVNPRSSSDARAFLTTSVFDFKEGDLARLERRPELVGLRLVFPPAPDSPGLFNVRIESYGRDNRSLFLENVGVFNAPVQTDELSALAERFDTTYGYLENNVIAFIAQFDA
ncbi:MAG: hypothetical protein AB1486_28320 [Planctomycetota bacterium]